jgi:hypothetical protein
MWLIRRRRTVLGMACALSMAAGCQIEHRIPGPEPTNATPIATDQAMVHRRWHPVGVLYTNDTVMAFPNYSPFRATNSHLNPLLETPLFLANTFYTIYGVFIDPPWQLVAYKSMSMPLTYTAMPPMPPSRTK